MFDRGGAVLLTLVVYPSDLTVRNSPLNPHSLTYNLSNTEPRYASLPNIMKAKKKPIEKLSPADLGVDISPRFETLKVAEPPKRVGGGKVANVSELVAKLREAGF